jgi:hypothetical protein
MSCSAWSRKWQGWRSAGTGGATVTGLQECRAAGNAHSGTVAIFDSRADSRDL